MIQFHSNGSYIRSSEIRTVHWNIEYEMLTSLNVEGIIDAPLKLIEKQIIPSDRNQQSGKCI